MHSKTRAALVAGLSATALLAACGGGDSGNTGGGDGAASNSAGSPLTIRGCNPQNDLIPANTTETCGGDVLDLTTSKLVFYTPENGKAENDLAESIDTKDSKVYTIKLQKGRKFSDGTEIKAKNFVDAWNMAAYGPNAMSAGSFMEPIDGYKDVSAEKATVKEMKGLKVVDDYTFQVTLSAPTSNFPTRLGYTAFAPMPDAYLKDPKNAEFGKKPVGAGPYKVTQWDANSQIVLEKDANYTGKFGGQADKIVYKIYQDSGAAYKDVQQGNLDVINEFPADAVVGGRYKTDLPDHWAVRNDTGGTQTITFAAAKSDPSLTNPKLRQAISMAINRQQIIDTIFNGERKPLTGWVAAQAVGDYQEGACGDFCTYNPDKAKALLKEAGGYNGTLTIGYNADSAHKAWVEATCQSITNTLGIQCQGAPSVDFKTLRDMVKKREIKGMFRTGWQMDYPSPENFLAPIFATGASSNDGDYSNPAFDAALAKAAAAPSEAEANKLYFEAEKMLANDMPAIPLWGPAARAGWSEKVTDVKIDAFGRPDYRNIKKS